MSNAAPLLQQSMVRAGYKVTAPRWAVIKAVAGMRSPLTASQILARSKRTYPRLGLVTVYRTLEILMTLGHLRRLHLEAGCHTYAAAHSTHAHYMICSRCGRAVEFDKCRMQAMLRSVAQRTGYRISDHWLELFGECPRCQQLHNSPQAKHGGEADAASTH
jgi:Fur family ferric uptake transcriptional regulator